MKNLKKLFGLMVASGLAFGFAGTVNAAVSEASNVCTVDSEEDIATALTYGSTSTNNHRCNTIKINTTATNFEIKGTYNLEDRTLEIAANTKVVVDGGSLKFAGVVKPNYTIKMTDTGAALEIKNGGLVEIGTSNGHGITGYGNNTGDITIDGANSKLYIHEVGNAMNNPHAVNVTNGATLQLENNRGYGLATNGTITLTKGTLISNGNETGVAGKIIEDENSTITANDNGKVGVTLKATSDIKGTVSATGNGNNSAKAENLRGDLALDGNSTINGGKVNVGKVVKDEYGTTNGQITVNKGEFNYSEKTTDVKAPKVTNGVITDGENGIIVNFTTDEDAYDIIINETTKVTNNSAFRINVCTEDSKVCTTVNNKSNSTVEVVKVTIDKVVYNLFKGQKITDLTAYEDLVKTAGFKSFLKANGHEFDIEDAIYNDTTLTISTTPQSSAPTDNKKPTDTDTNKKPAADNTASKNPQTYDAGIMGSLVLVLSSVGTLGYASKKVLSK